MYSRSYIQDTIGEGYGDSAPKIPKGYDGTALFEPPAKVAPEDGADTIHNEEYEEVFSKRGEDEHRTDAGFGIGKLLGKFLPKDLHFGSFFDDFGSEEILLIALAVFLFLSKSGDRECALIIAALLFIK